MITEIVDRAYKVYPDGREVCLENQRGLREYRRRIAVMAERQHGICSLCDKPLQIPTFEHSRPRGNGGGFRDDRIVDADGNWMNSAACLLCNDRKGSRHDTPSEKSRVAPEERPGC